MYCPIDLFFRKNPFNGEFTIFAGLSECLKFLENFRYSESDINYLRQTLPQNVEDEFFQYLRDLTPKDIKIYALQEGSIAFPRYWHFCIFPEFSVFFTECWTYPEAPLLFSLCLCINCISFVFSRIPLIRVEGPLIVAQLLETTLLTLVNFAR